jgi:preprotein translocase subunit SecY
MALGIMPYISASIIMQLLGMAVPAVQKMQNEGESGRKRINNYTRILTIIICALQAPTYLTLWVGNKNALPVDVDSLWWIQSTIVMVAGSMFAVWLGERITDKGIGNMTNWYLCNGRYGTPNLNNNNNIKLTQHIIHMSEPINGIFN